jgi:hypothetical protein
LRSFKKSIFGQFPIVQRRFIEELEFFSIRNAITGKNQFGEHISNVCMQCLRAFALEVANSLDFDLSEKDSIDRAFDCKIGHNGYYLDSGELKVCYF